MEYAIDNFKFVCGAHIEIPACGADAAAGLAIWSKVDLDHHSSNMQLAFS
jgi:hypothetical protein